MSKDKAVEKIKPAPSDSSKLENNSKLDEGLDRLFSVLEQDSKIRLKQIEIDEKRIKTREREIASHEKIATNAIDAKLKDNDSSRVAKKNFVKMVLNYAMVAFVTLIALFGALALNGKSELVEKIITYLALLAGGGGITSMISKLRGNATKSSET